MVKRIIVMNMAGIAPAFNRNAGETIMCIDQVVRGLASASGSAVLVLVLATVAQPAFAQDSELEEIVVTARRMQESLQDVPSSVSVMSADFVRAQRIQTVDEVIEMSPGATFTSLHKGQHDYSMRGISSQTEGSAGDSGVVTYVDGIAIGKDFAKSLKFIDVQQVEILRGPQGTAFGRNASAGLVHIITKRPTHDFEGLLEATGGNYGLIGFDGVLNGALSETIAGRLSVHYDDRDGYTEDLATGRDLDAEQNTTVRGQLLFTPSDSLDVLLKLEWSEDDDGVPIRKGPDCTQPYLEDPFGDFTEPSCDPWETIASDLPNLQLERTIVTGSANIGWDISDTLRFTSITGYVDAEMSRFQDIFGTPLDVVLQSNEDDASQFTQEFRLDNAAADGAMHWLAGFYYFADDHDKLGENREALTYAGPPFATTTDLRTSNETTSFGLFGQVSYDLSDRANLTVGGRYTKDEKDFSAFHETAGGLGDIFVDPAENPVDESASEDWDNVTGSASLSFDASENAMIYGIIATGYKSGGFNGEPYNAEAAVTPYDQETSTNYEIGVKSELLANRLRLNASLFSTQYEDLQVADFLPSGTPIIENSGGADVVGLELEFSWLVNDYLTLLGSYAKLDAELKGDIDGTSVDGNRPDNAPEWTATFAADVTIPLSNGSALSLRGDYRGRSDVFDGPFEDSETVRPSASFVGARAMWTSADNLWRVSLWGKNLTEEEEILTIGPQVIVSQHPTGYGAPRTYGATVSRAFR